MTRDTYSALVEMQNTAGFLSYDGLRASDRECTQCLGTGRVDYDGDEYPPGTMACWCRGATSARTGLGDACPDDATCDGPGDGRARCVEAYGSCG